MKLLNQKALYLIVFALAACGEGQKTIPTGQSLDAESLNDGTVNQAPKIVCSLTKNGEATPFRVINTITNEDTFGSNPRQGDVISVNCSGTEDEDALSQLAFAYDSDYQADAEQFASFANASFTFNASTVRDYPFAIRVVDSQGKETKKQFVVVVECNASAVAPSASAANIQVAKGSSNKPNEFSYSVVGSIASGVAGDSALRYAWDFNGDRVVDPIEIDDGRLDTARTSLDNVYSIFTTTGTNTRKVSLTVKNSCNKQTTVVADVAFDRAPHDLVGAAPAVEKGYFYIQGDITHTADLNNQRRNGEVLLTQYADDEKQRIICDYEVGSNGKAVFAMDAFNNYKEGTRTDNYRHGLQIEVRNVDDTESTSFVSSVAPNMSVSKYLVSEGGDNLPLEAYDRSGTCTVSIQVRKSFGVTPCANGTSIPSEVAIVLGEYSCPTLNNSSINQSVSLDNGKFYCQVAIGDQCVGGGGGGGGNPPPPQ